MKNDYWKLRELTYKKSVAETSKQLSRLYSATAANLRLQIIELYETVQRKGENVIPNDFYRNNNYFVLLSNINSKLNELGMAEIRIIEPELIDLYILSSESVSSDLGFAITNKAAVKEVVNSVWCADGQNWSARVWKNKEKMIAALTNTLNDCVSRGVPKDQAVSEFMRINGVGRRQADRIIRTELTQIQNRGALDTYAAAGLKHYEIHSADDERTNNDICSEMNGKVFLISNAQVGVNMPPFHPNCRCSIMPVIEE